MEKSASENPVDAPKPFFMEHRWGQRLPCRAHVRICASDDITGAGQVRDVSSSGAFIETAIRLPVYARVALVVLGNESATRTVEINASVVRVASDGIGVEWCDTPGGSICEVLGCTTRCAALKTRT
jgi:PilZ domain-containing protein